MKILQVNFSDSAGEAAIAVKCFHYILNFKKPKFLHDGY